jgi:hypothetical protein
MGLTRKRSNPIRHSESEVKPGHYKTGFECMQGECYSLYRCPICWNEFRVLIEDDPDAQSDRPTMQYCIRCKHWSAYESMSIAQMRDENAQVQKAAVQRRRKKPDTSSLGGLFD